MTRISLYGNKSQRTNLSHLQDLINNLGVLYPEVVCSVDERYMQFLQDNINMPESINITFSDNDPQATLALSIGGDGTFLKTANRIGQLGTPIMGINTGHLGYISAIDIVDAPEVIHDILRGQYRIEQRSVLAVECPSDIIPHPLFALNEVAILKKDTASMINIDARIDSWSLTSYRADGLIVSTPTGSTGYNLSVGGPVVAPTCSVWTIAPVAPHSLNMRPLVVNDSSILQLEAHSRAESFLLSLDGKSISLPSGTHLKVSKAPHKVHVVLTTNTNFIDTLREKLLWGATEYNDNTLYFLGFR